MKTTLLAAALMMFAAITAAAQCSDADKKALEAFDRAWGMAGEKGDKAALMTIYADDYMGVPGMQGKTATIDGTMAAFEANKKNPNPDKVTHDHYYISCTPNSAVITHRNTVWSNDGPGGKPGTFWTRSVHMLEKRGGKWQVTSNAGGGLLDDYATLWYLEQDWNDAGFRKDADWFEKNYASDFSSVSRDGKLADKAGDIADTKGDKNTYDMIETTNMNIRVDGNVGIVTGIYHSKGKDEKGAAFDRKLRFTDTWIKRDGRWQAWATAGATIKE